MRKIGLIGYPIEHSLSPGFFRKKYVADNLSYSYSLIQSKDFMEAISIFKKEYYAINVTAPFKERACKIVDILDDNSRISMAVNLLVKGNGSLIYGYNTDVTAVGAMLLSVLKQCGGGMMRVAVIGLGGAGKAAASAALLSGAEVVLCNRTSDKIAAFRENLANVATSATTSPKSPKKGIVSEFSEAVMDKIVGEYALKDMDRAIADADVVIYTLPRISSFKTEIIFDSSELKGKWLVEANYRDPLFNEKTASKQGFHYISGIEWFRLQAEETFRIIS